VKGVFLILTDGDIHHRCLTKPASVKAKPPLCSGFVSPASGVRICLLIMFIYEFVIMFY
jgi:hypothetical protein